MLFSVRGRIKKFLDGRELKENFKKVVKEFEEQSLYPPGNDSIIQACYLATLDLIRNDPFFVSILHNVLKQRSDLTGKHFVNLYFRALQYIKLFDKKNNLKKLSLQRIKSYLAKNHLLKEVWLKDIKKITLEGNAKNLFVHLLLTKDTATTKYQRYISLFALINLLFPKSSVKVCDFGCGANYGLKGIEKGEKFEKVADQTKKKFFTQSLQERPSISEGLGIDKEDPNDQKSRNWMIACSFYPSELNKLNTTLQFEQRIKSSKTTSFLEADLTAVPVGKFVPKAYFDIVIISTVLYQIPDPKMHRIILNKARSCLKRGGILILQDFVRKDKNGRLNFNESWFNQSYSYGTYVASSQTHWKLMEVFRFENGRCLKVKDGQDLKSFSKTYFPKTSIAALAHSTS